LGQVIGQCAALTPAPNVGEKKPHKAEGDCGFSNPVGGACRRRSSYCLLSEVVAFTIIFIIIVFFH